MGRLLAPIRSFPVRSIDDQVSHLPELRGRLLYAHEDEATVAACPGGTPQWPTPHPIMAPGDRDPVHVQLAGEDAAHVTHR
jgi:hypothetical protein